MRMKKTISSVRIFQDRGREAYLGFQKGGQIFASHKCSHKGGQTKFSNFFLWWKKFDQMGSRAQWPPLNTPLVQCIPGLIWADLKLWSLNSFYPARFNQTSQSARPDPMCIRVQYCFAFNFISAGNRDLGQGLYGSNQRKVSIRLG